jgi:hypothetical protein
MSKAHEEGGDLMSSERLASAFLTLGITTSEDEAEAEIDIQPLTNNTTVYNDHETENDPLSYKAALQSPQAVEWRKAMPQEWQALVENHTFDVVKEIRGNTIERSEVDAAAGEPIGCKWIYRRKMNPDGSTRYKARLVIKGYEQKEGIDYDETYTPVSKMVTFRLVLALAAQYGWDVDHMHVVTAFLNPKIDRDNIYMKMPLGIDWLVSTGSVDWKHIGWKRKDRNCAPSPEGTLRIETGPTTLVRGYRRIFAIHRIQTIGRRSKPVSSTRSSPRTVCR